MSLASSFVKVLWVGSAGGMEADLVKRAGVAYTEIPAAGVHGVGLRRLPRNLLALGRGYRAAGRILREFDPDVMMFTGGYVAVPMALAGRNRPSLVFVPDIEPGLALKLLARTAKTITVSAEPSRRYFSRPERVNVTGYPVREDLLRWKRREALEALGLNSDLPTLLVFGGSKGARSLNRALAAALPALLSKMQVVHVSGELDWPEVEALRSRLVDEIGELSERYYAYPYLHAEMGAAFAAADLVVCRSGASTLGELPAFELPAVLVPYPHAWRYQRVNADHLTRQGAAEIVEDAELIDRFLPVVQDLMDNPEKLQAMRRAMRQLAAPQAAAEIAALLIQLAGDRRKRGRSS